TTRAYEALPVPGGRDPAPTHGRRRSHGDHEEGRPWAPGRHGASPPGVRTVHGGRPPRSAKESWAAPDPSTSTRVLRSQPQRRSSVEPETRAARESGRFVFHRGSPPERTAGRGV